MISPDFAGILSAFVACFVSNFTSETPLHISRPMAAKRSTQKPLVTPRCLHEKSVGAFSRFCIELDRHDIMSDPVAAGSNWSHLSAFVACFVSNFTSETPLHISRPMAAKRSTQKPLVTPRCLHEKKCGSVLEILH